MGQLEEIETKLEVDGYQVLAISPDLPNNLKVSVGKHHLTYTLLSDSRMRVLILKSC
jgi:peroxiredoxin